MKAEFFHSSAIKDYTENLLPKLCYIHILTKKRPLNAFSHKPGKLSFFWEWFCLKAIFVAADSTVSKSAFHIQACINLPRDSNLQ